ncbi:MAG: spore coat U domain-containing protein [Gammaproteobacteria bacterium]|nr:spore coat U domain-containing protein [Gammaproteobacteria bacterium]MBU2066999.1 spore coat U domain-containing protein [Gammaproteobacteria bacterium]MBU2138962.1 spore coat U domain-containing protein [Gammaproteobacteria bacterium]MBU2216307.1 spore coat U domain-containing protein [Gammaproteobacteria bacterium]
MPLSCRLIVLIMLLLLGQLAHGACAASSSAVSLGTSNSLSLRTTAQQASASGGLRCDGILEALAFNYIRVTLASGSLNLQSGDQQIPFQVFSNSGYSQELLAGQPVSLTNIVLLGLGGTSRSVPLYFRTRLGSNVAAGTYTGSVTLTWQWAICLLGALNACTSWDRSPGLTQSCPLGLCGAPTNWGSGSTAVINLTLVVSKACLINSTPNLDFGSQALVSQFTPLTQSVSVTCTNTEGYRLGFDNGQHYQAPWRRMQVAGNYLRYNLFHPSTTTVWDNASQTRSATGTGEPQSFPFQAIIDPAQPNVPAGTYIDNVSLIISY